MPVRFMPLRLAFIRLLTPPRFNPVFKPVIPVRLPVVAVDWAPKR